MTIQIRDRDGRLLQETEIPVDPIPPDVLWWDGRAFLRQGPADAGGEIYREGLYYVLSGSVDPFVAPV